MNIENRMPKKETMRKYYKDSPLSDDNLMELAEFVRDQQGGQGVSMLSYPLKVLIAWEEQRMKEETK